MDIENLKKLMQSDVINDIRIFHVNGLHKYDESKQILLIDLAIEFHFNNGVVTAGFNSQTQSLKILPLSIKDMYEGNNGKQIETNHLQSFIGNRIEHIHFKTIELEFVSGYTMKTEKEEQIVDLKLELENGDYLHIAFVEYEIEKPEELYYDIFGEILVSLNHSYFIIE